MAGLEAELLDGEAVDAVLRVDVDELAIPEVGKLVWLAEEPGGEGRPVNVMPLLAGWLLVVAAVDVPGCEDDESDWLGCVRIVLLVFDGAVGAVVAAGPEGEVAGP